MAIQRESCVSIEAECQDIVFGELDDEVSEDDAAFAVEWLIKGFEFSIVGGHFVR